MQPKIFGTPLYLDIAHRYSGEYFEAIPGHESCYTISNYGRVKSQGKVRNNLLGEHTMQTRILKPAKNTRGYYTVVLTNGGAQKTVTVHRLMRLAFMPETAHLTGHMVEVDHIDGDKSNNVLSNLECVTSKVNKERAIRMGLMNNVGEAHGMAKLTELQVWEVLTEYHLNKLTRKQVSAKLGISEFTVKSIHNGTNWKHVYARFAEQHPEAVATDRTNSKLTAEQALEIYRSTERTSILAKQYEVCLDLIKKIRNGKLWASVTGHVRQ
jgi:hypothetical protein